MTMKPTDRMLLQLLSAAINAQDTTLDRALSDSEWNLVYGQAGRCGCDVGKCPAVAAGFAAVAEFETAMGVWGGADCF